MLIFYINIPWKENTNQKHMQLCAVITLNIRINRPEQTVQTRSEAAKRGVWSGQHCLLFLQQV